LQKKQFAKQKSAKNKQILIKTSPKIRNPQVFKKTRNFTKKTSPNSWENRKVQGCHSKGKIPTAEMSIGLDLD